MSDDPRAAHPLDAGEVGDEAAIEARLRRLATACAVLAAAVLVSAGAIGWTAARGAGTDWLASPPSSSFLIAFGAMLLVLLSSAAHGRILRLPVRREEEEPAGEESPAPAGESRRGGGWQDERQRRAAWSAERLRAYSWAIGIGFAMLGVAAALGAMVAVAGRAPFYGLAICVASLLGMAGRWPRRGAFEVALDAERQPPPPAGSDGADRGST